MCADTPMSWHLFGMGSEIDIHAAYFYGHTFTNRDQRADVVGLFAATFITAEMTPGNPGRWLITCQVNEHLRGMVLQISLIHSDTDIAASTVLEKESGGVPSGSEIWHFWLTDTFRSTSPQIHHEFSLQCSLCMLGQSCRYGLVRNLYMKEFKDDDDDVFVWYKGLKA